MIAVDQSMRKPNLIAQNTDHLFELLEKELGCFFYIRDSQGNFTYINASISNTLEHSANDFQANWDAYLTDNPINNENLSRFQSPAFQPGKGNIYEMEFHKKQGGRAWLRIIEIPVLNEQRQLLSINGVAWNITDTKHLENEVKLRDERFREISECTPIGIFQVDPDDLFIYVNTRWQVITGRNIRDILGHPWWHIIHEDDRERVFQSWTQAETEEQEHSAECRIMRVDGGFCWVLLRSRFFFYNKGKVTIGTIEDITKRRETDEKIKEYAAELEERNREKDQMIQELQQLKNQLEISAKTDPLTGLLNRRGMSEQIEQVKIRHERNKAPFTFIIMDIDHFKNINDTYGHDTGDYVLREIAKAMKDSLRKQDIVCRWGGEEFLVLLSDTDLRGGIILAEKCRSRIEKEPFHHKQANLRMTMSFGVSTYQETDLKVDACIHRADECLYEAKRTGRNKVVSQIG